MNIAIVGATGFVGSHLVPHLVTTGHRVVAISRTGRRLPDWTDAVEARAADVTTGAVLEEALAGADAVVHLVAIPRESKGRRFEEVNVRGTRRVVDAAQRAGIRRFVHLSVLGVVDDPKLDYLRSKARGEQIVRESSLDWVVLRPSLMFGIGDGFFNIVKTTLRYWSPGVVAIPGRGGTRFQPLSADDLAIAVERCLTDADRAGSVYELGGPEWLTYRQIVEEVMRVTGMRRLRLPIPIPLISALTAVTDRLLPVFPSPTIRSARSSARTTPISMPSRRRSASSHGSWTCRTWADSRAAGTLSEIAACARGCSPRLTESGCRSHTTSDVVRAT